MGKFFWSQILASTIAFSPKWKPGRAVIALAIFATGCSATVVASSPTPGASAATVSGPDLRDLFLATPISGHPSQAKWNKVADSIASALDLKQGPALPSRHVEAWIVPVAGVTVPGIIIDVALAPSDVPGSPSKVADDTNIKMAISRSLEAMSVEKDFYAVQVAVSIASGDDLRPRYKIMPDGKKVKKPRERLTGNGIVSAFYLKSTLDKYREFNPDLVLKMADHKLSFIL